jgi:hypothetical protein
MILKGLKLWEGWREGLGPLELGSYEALLIGVYILSCYIFLQAVGCRRACGGSGTAFACASLDPFSIISSSHLAHMCGDGAFVPFPRRFWDALRYPAGLWTIHALMGNKYREK